MDLAKQRNYRQGKQWLSKLFKTSSCGKYDEIFIRECMIGKHKNCPDDQMNSVVDGQGHRKRLYEISQLGAETFVV